MREIFASQRTGVFWKVWSGGEGALMLGSSQEGMQWGGRKGQAGEKPGDPKGYCSFLERAVHGWRAGRDAAEAAKPTSGFKALVTGLSLRNFPVKQPVCSRLYRHFICTNALRDRHRYHIFTVQLMKVSAEGNLPRGVPLVLLPAWVCPENPGFDSLCFPVWDQPSV